jgi:HSP20 family protein
MAIQRWDPLRELVDLQERMKQLFAEALSRSGGAEGEPAASADGFRPPIDLFEEGDRYVLRADLPGVSARDLDIQVENGVLVVRGERKVDANVGRESYLRVERPHGKFSAQVTLPPSVDVRSIRALHRNGVIEIVLPKRRDAPPSRIEVASG